MFGDGSKGQLGMGVRWEEPFNSVPYRVEALRGKRVTMLKSSGEHVCVKCETDGAYYMWGCNEFRQITGACGCARTAAPLCVVHGILVHLQVSHE